MAQVIGKSSGYLWRQAGVRYLLSIVAVVAFLVLSVYFLSALTSFSSMSVPPIVAIIVPILLLVLFKEVAEGLVKTSKSFEKRGDKFLRGEIGEVRALRVLKDLPDTYYVFPDLTLNSGRGNIDTVVVGPNGVFVVEVKNRGGRIGFDGLMLTVNERPFDKDFLAQANGEAMQVRDFIQRATSVTLFVHALLLFTNPRVFLRIPNPVRHVFVTNPAMVNRVIQNTRGSLPTDSLTKVVDALRAAVLKPISHSRE